MDRFLEQLKREFGFVRMLEIGVGQGATMAGVLERCDELGVPASYEGVDGECGTPVVLPTDCVFTKGDSAFVFPQVGDAFNFLFVDGSHASNYVCLDFLNYSPKVVVNGYCLFHDTREGPQWQGLHYQGSGEQGRFENNIAVRAALQKLGLLQGYRSDWKFIEEIASSDIMGMQLYKKLKQL